MQHFLDAHSLKYAELKSSEVQKRAHSKKRRDKPGMGLEAHFMN